MQPPSTADDDRSPDQRVRTRYYHTCGQMIWGVETPHGALYYAELLPVLPPPITHCPTCSAPLTPETLVQRRGRPGEAHHA